MIAWHRQRAARGPRHCGACVDPPHAMAEGEVYAVFGGRFVRCAACAARMGAGDPPEVVEEDAAPMTSLRTPVPPSFERVGRVRDRVVLPFDVKARAAGDA